MAGDDARTGVVWTRDQRRSPRCRCPDYPGVQLRSVARDATARLWLGTQWPRPAALSIRQRARARLHGQRDDSPASTCMRSASIGGPRLGGHGRRPRPGRTRPGRLRISATHPDQPDSLAGNLVRAVLEAADGTHLDRQAFRPEPRARTADGRSASSIRSPTRSAMRPVPVVFSIAESPRACCGSAPTRGLMRFDPAHAHGARLTAWATACRTSNSTAAPRCGCAMAGCCSAACAGSTCSTRARLHDSRVHAAGALAVGALRCGRRRPTRRPGVAAPRASTCRRTPACCACASARSTTPAAAASVIATGSKASIAAGSTTATQSEITYTRLPPGDYVFRAQATNRDGVWNPQELRVPVRVAPPLWRHPLALVAYALAGAGCCSARSRGCVVQRRRREQRVLRADPRSRGAPASSRCGPPARSSGTTTWRAARCAACAPHEGDDARAGIAVQTSVDQRHEIHGDDLPRVLERLKQHMRGETPLFLSEHRMRGPHGAWTWVRARGRVVERGADGRALRVAGTARDISAGRTAERERRIASEVLRSMSEAVAVLDRDFHSCRSTRPSAASAVTAIRRSSADRRACSTVRSTIRTSIARCAPKSNATAAGPARCGSSARMAKSSCAGSKAARCSTPAASAAITSRCSPTSPTRSAPSRNCATWRTTTR